jgi:tyrosyl-tRNA synthetase
MNPINIAEELTQRNLVAQWTDEVEMQQMLASHNFNPYVGFDATADSLHIGSLIPLLTLRRLQLANHRPIALVGGGTSLIGDPSFKAAERGLNTLECVEAWTNSIRRQIEPFLDFSSPNKALVVNNYDWLSQLEVLPFLRDVGKHFRVNVMINKDSVRQRLDREGEGLSFTEFAYSLLQALDFVELAKNHGCQMQLGGSDQWGNITAGIELARRTHKLKLYGLTQPLITRADGKKFGKTEAGTIWLDPNRTSPYAFHQYWLTVTDDEVFRFIRQFTFLPLDQIKELEEADAKSVGRREGQIILANEMTKIVHGPVVAERVLGISRALFGGNVRDLSSSDLDQLSQDTLKCVGLDTGTAVSLIDALVSTELAKSKNEARQLVSQGGISINGLAVNDPDFLTQTAGELPGGYVMLQRGKKQHALLKKQEAA